MWGRRHEKIALKMYEKERKTTTKTCGLFIYKKHNFIAVTPDAITEDDEAIIEIKCPYSVKNELASTAPFIKNGSLIKNHPYFTQIQLQMLVTEKTLAHFVVWTKKSLFIEFIEFDRDFAEGIAESMVEYYEKVFVEEYFKHNWNLNHD